ncbi:MAG: class I SAM-dependent methyltransferase [Paenisporosarcina sp.]
MSSYSDFARVYDELMTDIPYDLYVEKVLQACKQPVGKSLLDIGCGTGVLASKFADAGFHVQAVDLSEEMLTMAHQRFTKKQQQIPLFCMSMSELNGFEEIDVAMIAIDSLNYLSEEQQVIDTFSAVYTSLKKGGHFFFDVHSIYKMDEIFLDGPFTFENENLAYIWHTEKGEAPHSVYHDLTFFVKTEGEMYERFEEHHFQRTYAEKQYVSWLKEQGFSSVSVESDWTSQQPTLSSERLFFHAIK